LQFIKDLLSLLRVKHWTKNLFIFFALLFSEKLFEWQSLFVSAVAFFAFCFIAGSIYGINDIHDTRKDLLHPNKKNRPIASGRIGKTQALLISCILLVISSIIGVKLNFYFFVVLLLYFVLNLFYTFIGKNIIIIDAFCISLGFVLRVVGGAFAISVHPSGWMIMTTFFLSLFLGFGKRRNEIFALGENHYLHRKVLKEYDNGFLNHILISCGTISLLSYALYTLDTSVIQRLGTNKLIYTVPIVAYGFFRYMYLLWENKEGDPTDLILHDRNMLIDIFLWLASTILIVYITKGS
jgi:4-hydroxybenzoate polyprenyltransferase